MRFIRTIREIIPEVPNGLDLIYMHGYGGRLWQAKRHLSVLRKAGYKILALDFSYRLDTFNPQDLIDLIDEVDGLLKTKGLIKQSTLIIGISLGGLVGLNLLRRHVELDKLLAITGGDITHLPSKRSLKNNWKLTRKELSVRWSGVNMYSKQDEFCNKHMIMMLPVRDKIIDPQEVKTELEIQKNFNNIHLVSTRGGHLRTIITETIIFPKRNLKLFERILRSRI